MNPEYDVCFAYTAPDSCERSPAEIVEINQSVTRRLAQLVSNALAAGWQLSGGVAMTMRDDGCIALAQAVVKYGGAGDEIPY